MTVSDVNDVESDRGGGLLYNPSETSAYQCFVCQKMLPANLADTILFEGKHFHKECRKQYVDGRMPFRDQPDDDQQTLSE